MNDDSPPPIHDPAHWDKVAERYAAEADRMTGMYARSAWDLAGLPASERVLDVATGAGALLVAALDDGAEAIGIDFSLEMVRVAQARAAAVRPGRHALVMDGQRLDFPAADFDAAFSMFGVFMFPDPAAGFAEMARVLRPAGLAVVAVWENAGGAGPAQLFQQAAAELFPDRPVPIPMSRLFNHPDLLDAAFADAGLLPERVVAVRHAWPAPGTEWVRANARLTFGWSPLWQESTEEQRDALATRAGELVEALRPEGITSTALIGFARKPGSA